MWHFVCHSSNLRKTACKPCSVMYKWIEFLNVSVICWGTSRGGVADFMVEWWQNKSEMCWKSKEAKQPCVVVWHRLQFVIRHCFCSLWWFKSLNGRTSGTSFPPTLVHLLHKCKIRMENTMVQNTPAFIVFYIDYQKKNITHSTLVLCSLDPSQKCKFSESNVMLLYFHPFQLSSII